MVFIFKGATLTNTLRGAEHLIGTTYKGIGVQQLFAPGADNNQACYAYQMLGNAVVGRYYLLTATVAGSGNAQMTVYDGNANQYSNTVALNSSWQTISMIVQMKSATAGQVQVGVPGSSSTQNLYFTVGSFVIPNWNLTGPGSGDETTDGVTIYNNGYFDEQALYLTTPANDEGQSLAQFPADHSALQGNTTYTASVDLAGTGSAYLELWNGTSDSSSSTVTLGSQWQTVTANFTTGAIVGGARFGVRLRSGTGSSQTVYFRNASLIKSSTSWIAKVDFKTGLESGDTQMRWMNTVDTDAGGGGERNVTGALTYSSSTITRGGRFAIQYGGMAVGGHNSFAYLEAFNPSLMLQSTSRLSYWIYPMTPMGNELGASSTTGLDSTCVSLDIVFTDGTAMRNLGVLDQFGNSIAPNSQCNHLQPDQWNYVTAYLGALDGKTVSRIDVGYSKPNANGNYAGFIDDIRIWH